MGATGKLIDYFSKVPEFAGVRTEVRGSRYVCLEGCDGIISYSGDEVAVRAGKLRITVLGKDLKIAFFSAEGIVVEGRVNSVNYGFGEAR